jgi:hypothetical protein
MKVLTIEQVFGTILNTPPVTRNEVRVPVTEVVSPEQLIERMDDAHRRACAAERELFSLISQVDRLELWHDSGARDMAHWLSMRYGTSDWKARRWIASSHALESLPLICEAFSSGVLGIDKVVELTRFAAPETERRLISWARRVSCGAIRHKGDLALRRSREEIMDVEKSRSLTWWYDDEGKRFAMQADLPAHQGAVVAKALERVAASLPVMPGEDGRWCKDARMADALVAVCSTRISSDPDPDRATVVIHARLEGLLSGDGGCEIEGGPVISPETARRLLCSARVQTVVEDPFGQPLGLGRIMREPPAWMMRQLRYRDRECTFPGCGSRRFTQAHHITWWDKGGRTDLENLVLIYFFHHRLVHEYGWRLARDPDGTVRWSLPDGTRYRAGSGPPRERTQREPALAVAAF